MLEPLLPPVLPPIAPAARVQPGPRPVPRATSPNGSPPWLPSAARHRLGPPLIVLLASTWAGGSSLTKRDGIAEVHCP